MSGVGAGRYGQTGTCIVRNDNAADRCLGRRCAGVVRGNRRNVQHNRRGSRHAEAVRCGVGEGVEARVVHRWGIGVGAVAVHNDSAMARCGTARHGKANAEVVGQHGRAIQDSIGRSSTRVI